MKNLPQRKSIRLKNYDYSWSGFYFITICTQNRKRLFGKITDGKMVFNDAGKIIHQCWLKNPNRFGNVILDEFQIMPNHLHGIIVITNKTKNEQPVGAGFIPARSETGFIPARSETGFIPARSNTHEQEIQMERATTIKRATTRVAPTVGNIVGAFKSLTTREYINGVKTNEWKPFNKRLWQRNYYEHIIRNETDLNKIREYIINNPKIWYRDRNNPKNWRKK